jgi:predicted nucleotidyltransferase
MTGEDYLVAKELKERLSKVVQLVDMRVFGSRASGEADEYSDLDVFIEVEGLDKALEETVNQIAWEVGFEHSVFISPLVFTRNEIENSPLRVAPIVKNIAEEGVTI